jgi:glycosyltransferase involved in cell wall biosynthesis
MDNTPQQQAEPASPRRRLRICLVYDSLQPYRIGGAERWYYGLADRLAGAGHEVTYLTMRQWDRGATGHHPSAQVIAVGPWMENYRAGGKRTMLPPLLFGLGVLVHLLRHGRRYDVVHTSSFPYFSVLAAAIARPFAGYQIGVDWLEFWSRSYWRSYLGPMGEVGWAVQRACLAVRQHAFCLAQLTAQRLRANDVNGEVEVLTGLYSGDMSARVPAPAELSVLFAARLIPEKRLVLAIEAIARARRALPGLVARVFGRGPEWDNAVQLIAKLGLEDVIEMTDFVERPVLEATMARSLCLLHPSSREGYGLVVVEASAMGLPSILVAGEDNAATELVADGVNGVVVAEPSPELLADAIIRVHKSGQALRTSTADWFAANAARLSIDGSLSKVVASYGPSAERD